MSSAFDPYYKWLGIPPRDQPPHHYRLLGIELYEPDREVIESAATRITAQLQTLTSGDEAEHAYRLLGEVTAARRCLLDPEKKAAYDAELRTGLAAQPSSPATPVTAPAIEAASPNLPAETAPPPMEEEGEGGDFSFLPPRRSSAQAKGPSPAAKPTPAVAGGKSTSGVGKPKAAANGTPGGEATAKATAVSPQKKKTQAEKNFLLFSAGVFLLAVLAVLIFIVASAISYGCRAKPPAKTKAKKTAAMRMMDPPWPVCLAICENKSGPWNVWLDASNTNLTSGTRDI